MLQRKAEVSEAVLRHRQLEAELHRKAQIEEARERAEIAKQRLLMKVPAGYTLPHLLIFLHPQYS